MISWLFVRIPYRVAIDMERVYWKRVPGYEGDELQNMVDIIFETFHVYDELKPGMTAVLKPNLILRCKPETAIITHPAFTAAVGRCVKRAGAKVLIAESPGGPYTPAVMKSHYKACGYTDMAEACGFSLYTDCKSREVFLPEALRCRQLSVVEPFLDGDYLIDLAKLKTHGMTGFSGAVKNLFGAVPGLQKPELHCRFPEREDFAQMLVDLAAFLKPDLCFLDGIWAMEGDGPTGGIRRELGVLGAAKNPWALDVCGTELVGIEPDSVLMLRDGARRGLGPLSLEEIELLGDLLEDLRVTDFKKARASSTDFLDRLPKFLRPAAKKFTTPYPKIDKKNCVGCGKCAESCPQHTIQLRGGKAEIGYKDCIRCFCCHEMCPQHVIGVKRLGAFRW